MTLDQVKVGFRGTVSGLEGDAVVVERLREIGFCRGEAVALARIMVFGDPLIVEVRGVSVALRKREAQCVQVVSSESAAT